MKGTGWKKKLGHSLIYFERVNMIDKDEKSISISRQSELLSISKSSIYYDRSLSDRDIEIMNKIDEIYTDQPSYWKRRISKALINMGYIVWKKKVRTYMGIMWIEAIYPKKKTTISDKQHKKYPYLLKDIDIIEPNQVWAADITYIRLKHWRVYLIVIVDRYSRYILSWELSLTLDTEFCMSALKKAIEKYWKPIIFNTDQWVQFTSKDFTSTLEENGIQISMDWKWRRIDNVIVERLFRTIKYEEVYQKDYETPKDAYQNLALYIEKYNNRRLHSSLDYKTPGEIYWNIQQINKLSTVSPQTPLPYYYDYLFNNVIILKDGVS